MGAKVIQGQVHVSNLIFFVFVVIGNRKKKKCDSHFSYFFNHRSYGVVY